MRISRISAVIAAAILAVSSLSGCGTKKPSASSPNSSSSAGREIGKEKIEVSMNEDTLLNESNFKVNSIIDAGITTDTGQKYIYIDVTIKNNMTETYKVNALNNFYLLMDDGTELYTDIRTDIYAKQHVNGYEQLLEVPAGGDFNGYVGFLIPPSTTSFTVCYFATGTTNDKESVIQCPVTAQDIVPAPAGFITE